MDKPYEPRVGEMVKIELYMKVKRIQSEDKGIMIDGHCKINENEEVYVVGVPVVACEPFEPVRDYEKSQASHD